MCRHPCFHRLQHSVLTAPWRRCCCRCSLHWWGGCGSSCKLKVTQLESAGVGPEPSQRDSSTRRNHPRSKPPSHAASPCKWLPCWCLGSVCLPLDGELVGAADTLCNLCLVPRVGPAHGRDSKCGLNLMKLNGIELYYIRVCVWRGEGIHTHSLPLPLLFSLYVSFVYTHICTL